MRIKLVKIGNSMGLRLPKTIIKSCGFETEVDLEIKEGGVYLKPAGGERSFWKDMFQSDVQQNPVREKGEWEW